MRPVLAGALGTAVILAVSLVGCQNLRRSRPIVAIEEYEKLIIGRLDANYVGTEACLSGCHEHDKLRDNLAASTMGAQMSEQLDLPMVDCESCHGPGSLAIEHLQQADIKERLARGERVHCRADALLDLKRLPPPAKSMVCLRCHTKQATFNLHAWNAGAHAASDVTCFDCHNVHAGPSLWLQTNESDQICARCHQKVTAELNLPSRHPTREHRVGCVSCHQPHGTTEPGMLVAGSVRETCGSCHRDKLGPFVVSHGDTTDDCMQCHAPHGSASDNLLTASEPFLCLQCHQGHWVDGPGGASPLESKATFYSRCTDCHAAIHGTDTPSATGRGTMLR